MASYTIVLKDLLIRTVVWKSVVLLCFVGSTGLAVSCSRAPKLDPHVSRLELEEQIKQATLIVVGVAEDERALPTAASELKEESMPLQLRAVSIRVEGVLKGRFDGKRLTFYYYQTTGAWDGPPINILSPEERGLFYLVNDGGLLRATNDVYLSHTRLVTGKHKVSPVTDTNQIHAAIARLLLVPGTGAEVAENLASWRRSEAVALDLVPQTQVIRIIQDALTNSDRAIRGRACLLLAEFPLNQKDCLPEVVHDAQVLPEDRKRAEELMKEMPKL